MHSSLRRAAALAAVAIVFAPLGAFAQKKYDTGATDTEIKIGNIMPYSGPASAYAVSGKTEAAYFNKINTEGGINGRKIKFISYDDGYLPPKAVEQARKLVESDGGLLIFNSLARDDGSVPARAVEQARKLVESDGVLVFFNSLGTPSNSAIQKYMNDK